MKSMTIQVFAKFLNAMMRIPFAQICSTGILSEWICSSLIFFKCSFQSELVQFLFYFYLLLEQICSYFFLFFLVSFSIFFFFFARYIDCVHHRSMWLFFFFKRKAMCMAMFFWVMHSHINFLGDMVKVCERAPE